jgi:hypothetical protein
MAYGIQLYNDQSQLLIDSEFEHFHFAGKASLFETTQVPYILQGNDTQHSTRDGQSMSSSQINGHIHKFILYANASSDSPPPMCFIKPVGTGSSVFGGGERCAIILTQRSGANWIMWVLSSSSAAPSMYCFLPLRRMLSTYAAPGANDKFSLETFSSAGIKTYDARVRPLKVIASGSVASPAIARTASKANGWNPIFTPDNSSRTSFPMPANTLASDLMFYCPSIAHSCQDHSETHSGDGFQTQGYNSFFYAWARQDLWWCFYRNTFRLGSGYIDSGYTIYASGHVWKSEEDTTSILGALALAALAFVTFGASLIFIGAVVAGVVLTQAFTNANVASGTYYPYRNGSRNADANGFMISRASFYD